MDVGPDFRDGLMWIFTLGQPSDELMASLGGLMGVGNFDWVVVPMRSPGMRSMETGEIAVAGQR